MVDEDIDVKQFCNRHVEVMGTESDHIHIVALSDALQVSLETRSPFDVPNMGLVK
jgi:ubiquitin thioesterase protein OTUB1